LLLAVSFFGLYSLAARAETLAAISLANTIDTSVWNPPSSDPSGLDVNGNLIYVSDGEIDETPLWANANVFIANLDGSLVSTCNISTFTNEPVGLAVNPANGHVFFASDTMDKVFEVHLGGDGTFCTGDDTVTSFSTLGPEYGTDPISPTTDIEGLAYGGGNIIISGGQDQKAWVVNPGPNGLFTGGDDIVTILDLSNPIYNMQDVEGVGYHPVRGTLFFVSRNGNRLIETHMNGTLISDLGSLFSLIGGGKNLAGVGIGPSTTQPGDMSIYIAARGIDPGPDPLNPVPGFNDGKIYEFTVVLDPIDPTPTPTDPTPTDPTPTDPTPTTPPPAPGDIVMYLPAVISNTSGGQ
jgi:hypothetical protein